MSGTVRVQQPVVAPLRRAPFISTLLLAFSAGVLPAVASDSWLIADKHTLDAGQSVWLAVLTGEIFPIADAPMSLDRISKFVDHCGDNLRTMPDPRAEDQTLAIHEPLSPGGIHVIGCVLEPRLIQLKPDRFEAYLRDERAESALAAFEASHEETAPVVERYTKFVKTVVEVQPAPDDDRGYQTPLGHRLEIIPLSNPCRWKTRTTVKVKVLLDGYPWANVPISAAHEGFEQQGYAYRTKTDVDGTASLYLKRSGHWFVKAHLIRPIIGLGEYQWESFWSTMSFDVRDQFDVIGSLQAVRNIHGGISPWAVTGYRLGEAALRELNLPQNSEDLLAICRAPNTAPFAGIVDGVQAATGATLGKLNLRLVSAPAEDIRCEFIRLSDMRRVILRVRAGAAEMMIQIPGQESDALSLKLIALGETELFEPDVHSDALVTAPASLAEKQARVETEE